MDRAQFSFFFCQISTINIKYWRNNTVQTFDEITHFHLVAL
jgi:hypothetical protein